MTRQKPAPLFLFALVLIAAVALGAARAAEGDPGGRSGLKVPRFASLRAPEVNLRTGPGVRYPVDWVLSYRGMPVEITNEFDTWRKVRDWQGTEGWVHQSMLSGRRTVIVRAGVAPMRREPSSGAAVVARVQRKVLGRLLSCQGAWCRVEVSGLRGWMQRSAIFGVYPKEKIE
jgi:SH3-like domain-containing protein